MCTSATARPTLFPFPTGQHLRTVRLEPAKEIDADRLQFPNVPSFNPKGIFDEETFSAFQHPETLRKPGIDLEVAQRLAPRVKVRGNLQNQINLF